MTHPTKGDSKVKRSFQRLRSRGLFHEMGYSRWISLDDQPFSPREFPFDIGVQ